MRLLRNPTALMALTTLALLLLYFSLVAGQVATLVNGDGASQALGILLLVLPVAGIAFAIRGWRLGNTTQQMVAALEGEGRLPIHDGETGPDGRLTDEAAAAVFEVVKRGVEERPKDWRAWFHVAYAYAAVGDRKMARKALGHAAGLFRRERMPG
jgi:hypothetical protein